MCKDISTGGPFFSDQRTSERNPPTQAVLQSPDLWVTAPGCGQVEAKGHEVCAPLRTDLPPHVEHHVHIFVQTARLTCLFRQDLKYPASAEKNIENHPLFSSRIRFEVLIFVKDPQIRPPDENKLGYLHFFSTAPRKSRVLTKILV